MTLKTEMQEAAEQIEAEMEAPHAQRVREIQQAVADEVAEARGVPAALAALAPKCRPLAVEAIDALADTRFSNAHPALRTMIEATRQHAKLLLELLNDGGARATRLVDKIDNLSWARVAPWSTEAYIRVLRDELRSTATLPRMVEDIYESLGRDVADIQRHVKSAPLVGPYGNFDAPEARAKRQETAE